MNIMDEEAEGWAEKENQRYLDSFADDEPDDVEEEPISDDSEE